MPHIVRHNVRQNVQVYTLLKQISYEAAVCKSFLFGPRHDFPRSGNRNHTQDDFYQKFIHTLLSFGSQNANFTCFFLLVISLLLKISLLNFGIANSKVEAAALIWHLLLFMYW